MLSCSRAAYCSPGSSFTRVRLWPRTLTLPLQAWPRWAFPAAALIPTIGLQLVAGLAIAVGWHARSAAAALGLFCLATAFLFHTNFANRNELLHFEKDLAIAGGMFVLMVCGAGSLSVDTYVRRNARHESSGRLTNGEIAGERQTS